MDRFSCKSLSAVLAAVLCFGSGETNKILANPKESDIKTMSTDNMEFKEIQAKRNWSSDFFEKQWANVLIIDDDTDNRGKADDIIKAIVKDVDKEYTTLDEYESGCVYKTRNNDKLRFIKFSYDEFMKLEDHYNDKYIVDSTSHIFYVLGKNSGLDHLKKFHDKFNKIWCGDDFDYDKEPFVAGSHDYRKWYTTMAGKKYDKRNTRDVFLFFGCSESDCEKFMEGRPGLKEYWQRMPGMENQLYGDVNASWKKLKIGYTNEALLYPRLPYDNYSVHSNFKIGSLIFRDQARICHEDGKLEKHLRTGNALLLTSTVLGAAGYGLYKAVNNRLKNGKSSKKELNKKKLKLNRMKQRKSR